MHVRIRQWIYPHPVMCTQLITLGSSEWVGPECGVPLPGPTCCFSLAGPTAWRYERAKEAGTRWHVIQCVRRHVGSGSPPSVVRRLAKLWDRGVECNVSPETKWPQSDPDLSWHVGSSNCEGMQMGWRWLASGDVNDKIRAKLRLLGCSARALLAFVSPLWCWDARGGLRFRWPTCAIRVVSGSAPQI